MPFKNRAQMRALFAKDPKLAREWVRKYGVPDKERAMPSIEGFSAARSAAKRGKPSKHEGFAKRLASLQSQNPHRKVGEDEVGGSYKAGSPQRVARPSVAAMNRPKTKAGMMLAKMASKR